MAGSHTRRTRGEGAVYKIADGSWRASLRLTNPMTGATSRRAVRGLTKASAVGKLDKLRKDAHAGTFQSGEKTGAYLLAWLESVKPNVRPSTFRGYQRYLVSHVIPAFGTVDLARLTPANVEQLTTWMIAKGLSPSTARGCRTVLRHALADAARSGLLLRNVAALARPPRVERVEMRTLTAGQVRELLAATAEDPFGPLFTVAVTSGLRLGELLGLEWPDVDLEAGSMTVQRALAMREGGGWHLAEPKTVRSRRTVNLPSRAVDALLAERRRQADYQRVAGTAWQNVDELVFTDTIGRHLSPSGASHAFRTAADELRFDGIHFHSLRHTAATLALSAGVGLKTVSDMLGHSTITLTADTYAHTTSDQRREAADALDRVLA